MELSHCHFVPVYLPLSSGPFPLRLQMGPRGTQAAALSDAFYSAEEMFMFSLLAGTDTTTATRPLPFHSAK